MKKVEKALNVFAVIIFSVGLMFLALDYGRYKRHNKGPQGKREIQIAVREMESEIVAYKQEKIEIQLELERVEYDILEVRDSLTIARAEEANDNDLEIRLDALTNLKEDLKAQLKRLKSITTSIEGDLEPLLMKHDN